MRYETTLDGLLEQLIMLSPTLLPILVRVTCKIFGKIVGCNALGNGRDLLGRSGCDNSSTLVTPLWSNIDYPIARGGYPHIMLNDDNAVPSLNQTVELFQQLFDIRWMQPGCWFVENVKRSATLRTLQFSRKFNALGFTARKLGGRLAEPDIAESNLAEHA